MYSMTLLKQEMASLVDPFAHTKKDSDEIRKFDFVKRKSIEEKEKILIEETYCTLVTVGGKFVGKESFKKVMVHSFLKGH